MTSNHVFQDSSQQIFCHVSSPSSKNRLPLSYATLWIAEPFLQESRVHLTSLFSSATDQREPYIFTRKVYCRVYLSYAFYSPLFFVFLRFPVPLSPTFFRPEVFKFFVGAFQALIMLVNGSEHIFWNSKLLLTFYWSFLWETQLSYLVFGQVFTRFPVCRIT